MAKYERQLTGDFDGFLNYLHGGILGGSITAKLQDGGDYVIGQARCAVRVYERYSAIGSNRLSANVTVLGVGNQPLVSVIAAGGSQAMFFKVNTWGEQAFCDKIAEVIEGYVRATTPPVA